MRFGYCSFSTILNLGIRRILEFGIRVFFFFILNLGISLILDYEILEFFFSSYFISGYFSPNILNLGIFWFLNLKFGCYFFSTILNIGISLILKYEIWEFSISFSAILNLGISLILQFMIGVLIFSNYFKFWIFLYFQNWRFSFPNVLNLGISLLVFGIWGIFVFQPLDIWVFPWFYNLRFGRFSFSNILYFSDFDVWVYFLLF